jgi:hypothetical protein
LPQMFCPLVTVAVILLQQRRCSGVGEALAESYGRLAEQPKSVELNCLIYHSIRTRAFSQLAIRLVKRNHAINISGRT